MFALSSKILLLGSLLVAALFSTTSDAASSECIQGVITAQSTDSWRLQLATGLQAGTISPNDAAARIAQCFPTQLPVCLLRTKEYSTRFDIASAGNDVTAAQDGHKRPPSELLRPGATELEYVIPENVEQLASEHGWPVVRYKSRHAGGFDSETSSLLMILVPGDKVTPVVNYDRWLNIALPADEAPFELTPSPQAPVPGVGEYAAELQGGKNMPRTFTMVTVERAQEGVQGQVFFQMFNRAQSGSAVFTPRENSSVTSCYTCHPNGLRAISPLGFHVRAGEAQLPESSWRAVKVINEAMDDANGHAPISWRDAVVNPATGERKTFLKPKVQGPLIGSLRPLNPTSRTQEFIMGATRPDGSTVDGCFKTRSTVPVRDIFGRAPGRDNTYSLSAQPSIRWEKVRDSMRCATCHNNTSRAAFNEQTDFSQIDFKILVDQSMPFGAHQNPLDQGDPSLPVKDDMTGDERIALANCLRSEFDLERQQLVKWLTQGACQ